MWRVIERRATWPCRGVWAVAEHVPQSRPHPAIIGLLRAADGLSPDQAEGDSDRHKHRPMIRFDESSGRWRPKSDEGTMSNGDLNWIANFIWGIADDVLRDLYVRGKYRDVILPMTVLRRWTRCWNRASRQCSMQRQVSIRRGLRIRTPHFALPRDRAFTTPRNSRCATCAIGGANNS